MYITCFSIVERLVKVLEILEESGRGKKCNAVEGLTKEGESILEDTEPWPVRDAGIISASQKIEHYELLRMELYSHLQKQ